MACDPTNETATALKRDLLKVISATKATLSGATSKTSGENGEKKKRKAHSQVGNAPTKDGEVVIPGSLKILPTDSEKAIERKKKRIKSIKRKAKVEAAAARQEKKR